MTSNDHPRLAPNMLLTRSNVAASMSCSFASLAEERESSLFSGILSLFLDVTLRFLGLSSPSQGSSRLRSSIDGMMSSGSGLDLLSILEDLLRGVSALSALSDGFCGCLAGCESLPDDDMDLFRGSYSSSPSLSTTHESPSCGLVLLRAWGVFCLAI